MSQVKGILAFAFITVNTIGWALLIYIVGLVRAVWRQHDGRLRLLSIMSALADGWVACNKWMLRVLNITRIEEDWSQASGLSPRGWHLVISNHQGWSDIFVLQTTFLGRVPPLKFFVKRVLIWVPGVGVAMWLLGYPYVHRFSRQQLASDPALRELDRLATLKACELFKHAPTSVLNFLEGTRFTEAKHAAQGSTYHHLLLPKVGGLGYVIGALGRRVQEATDVTIYYPLGVPSFWGFLCGACPVVRIEARNVAIPVALQDGGSYLSVDARECLRVWVEEIWRAKDARLAALNRLHA